MSKPEIPEQLNVEDKKQIPVDLQENDTFVRGYKTGKERAYTEASVMVGEALEDINKWGYTADTIVINDIKRTLIKLEERLREKADQEIPASLLEQDLDRK